MSDQEIVGWLPTVSLLLMGAAISQDVDLHFLAGTVLLLAAVLVLVIARRLDLQ